MICVKEKYSATTISAQRCTTAQAWLRTPCAVFGWRRGGVETGVLVVTRGFYDIESVCVVKESVLYLPVIKDVKERGGK